MFVRRVRAVVVEFNTLFNVFFEQRQQYLHNNNGAVLQTIRDLNRHYKTAIKSLFIRNPASENDAKLHVMITIVVSLWFLI